ncbi:homocysteine S-methyltransferase family protein [Leucobacter sp. cx-169]|nr:homocysteine S-methyltransferase family protein [Leucobacter sp. cx-169]
MSHMIADGGIETELEDRLGQELTEFAAYPLLATASGREALREYFRPYMALAETTGIPIVLDTPTWRANADWGSVLGDDAESLARVNADAVAFVRTTAEAFAPEAEVVVNGCVGPRFDEFDAATRMSPEDAERYHAPQVAALAEAGADRVTSVTTLDAAEAIGVVRAAVASRVPAYVSFTVGEDGLLADGSTLDIAIRAVDEATGSAASGFLINCAHPAAAARALAKAPSAGARERLVGVRLNAAHEGDEGPGDAPEAFAAATLALANSAPSLAVFGGCCGTGPAHIGALAGLLG